MRYVLIVAIDDNDGLAPSDRDRDVKVLEVLKDPIGTQLEARLNSYDDDEVIDRDIQAIEFNTDEALT